MADEAMLAPALEGVTERLDAQYDAHGADDDGAPITRNEGAKHCYYALNFTTDYRPAPMRTGNLISTPRKS